MNYGQFLVDFSPEPLLEVLLGPLERLVVLECVQVGEHAHDPGEAVHLGKSYSKFGEIFFFGVGGGGEIETCGRR
jgi:hypothetical protein